VAVASLADGFLYWGSKYGQPCTDDGDRDDRASVHHQPPNCESCVRGASQAESGAVSVIRREPIEVGFGSEGVVLSAVRLWLLSRATCQSMRRFLRPDV